MRILSEIFSKPFKKRKLKVLPRLGREYDRNYAVKYTKELEKILYKSGYKIKHYGTYSTLRLPFYDLKDYMTANPYRKTGAEASHSGFIKLSAEEFLKMFE